MTIQEVTDQDYFHYILDKASKTSQLVSGPGKEPAASDEGNKSLASVYFPRRRAMKERAKRRDVVVVKKDGGNYAGH